MPIFSKTSDRYTKCCAFAIKATAITLPLIVINWFFFRSLPCFATRSSNGRITSSFINATIEEFATIAEVYSAGLPDMPAKLIF